MAVGEGSAKPNPCKHGEERRGWGGCRPVIEEREKSPVARLGAVELINFRLSPEFAPVFAALSSNAWKTRCYQPDA
jgi:hypothetical protein